MILGTFGKKLASCKASISCNILVTTCLLMLLHNLAQVWNLTISAAADCQIAKGFISILIPNWLVIQRAYPYNTTLLMTSSHTSYRQRTPHPSLFGCIGDPVSNLLGAYLELLQHPQYKKRRGSSYDGVFVPSPHSCIGNRVEYPPVRAA